MSLEYNDCDTGCFSGFLVVQMHLTLRGWMLVELFLVVFPILLSVQLFFHTHMVRIRSSSHFFGGLLL